MHTHTQPILRINFNIPTATGRREGIFAFAPPEAAWIRELTYRSTDMGYLDQVWCGLHGACARLAC